MPQYPVRDFLIIAVGDDGRGRERCLDHYPPARFHLQIRKLLYLIEAL